MLQVTPQSELAELQAKVARLVKQRDETIRFAHALIRQANQDFDDMAVELGRRINEIRADMAPPPEPEPDKPKRAARPRRTETAAERELADMLDDDDRQHFTELLAKRKARR